MLLPAAGQQAEQSAGKAVSLHLVPVWLGLDRHGQSRAYFLMRTHGRPVAIVRRLNRIFEKLRKNL